MPEFTVNGRAISLEMSSTGICQCLCGASVRRNNMHRHLKKCSVFRETSTVVHENNAIPSQETSTVIHENHAIACQETSADRTRHFVFGAGFHKPFTVSPPVPQQPDSDTQIIFRPKVQLTLIEDLINKGRSIMDEFLKVQEMSLKRKLVSADELERTIALQNQNLEELRTFANKATTVSQRTADASKRIRILAQEAQRLGEATARELEAHKDIIQALPMIKYESSPPLPSTSLSIAGAGMTSCPSGELEQRTAINPVVQNEGEERHELNHATLTPTPLGHGSILEASESEANDDPSRLSVIIPSPHSES
ncbi:MAG: hypothetical protein BYD32DRAFT_405458 [Podila humilis]|nr:MAG: hypothetical protein BYD32DRAFT_405458 [Podila humilis]